MSPLFRQPQPILSLLLLSLLSVSSASDLHSLLTLKASLSSPNSNSLFTTWSEQNPISNFTGITTISGEIVTGLNLSRQNLSGSIPFGAVCSLKNLTTLSLSYNSLLGNVQDLSNCTKLEILDLGFNFFTGEVPNLSSLTNLKVLSLNNSGFSGKFPWKSIENLRNIEFLSLGDNLFDDNPFPNEVLNLGNLYWLYLTNCSLKGEIPEGIRNLSMLENLELSSNALSGEIPNGVTNLKRLWQLELYDNNLSGKLPAGFGNLSNLVNFDASTNNLEGELSEIKYLKKIESLQLFENHFSGEIPLELGEFKFLKELSLYTNELAGPIPMKLGSWSDFEYIDISENFLTGEIPIDMCKKGKLTGLLLLQNNLTGNLPENYANCASLIRLRVSDNVLSGKVPIGIWKLPNLEIIDLASNHFEGHLGPDLDQAMSLAQIFLAQNKFSGKIPVTIGETKSLVAIDLSSNQFLGEIPREIGTLKKLSNFYLEHNMFSGEIPNSLGLCVSLSDLNLASNSFSGRIPKSMGLLSSLNSLNLSDNKLSGEIPTSLSSLRLSLLDLSNNQLVGPIPKSLSVYAFNRSFLGNPGLYSGKVVKSSSLHRALSCIIAGALILVLSLLTYMGVVYVRFKTRNLESPTEKSSSWDMKHFHTLTFAEDDILNGIKNENLIGKGGSGNVYRVALRNGNLLAVKHISNSGSIRSPEYNAEVATLSSVRHVNVVKLYCRITSEDSNLLVYEYFPNGSLWDRLHKWPKVEMAWELRYEIAIGSAKGLEYLHHGCDRAVIHRDVKTGNILLDEEMKPKIADFGLAKVVNVGKDSTHVVAGTLGYIAPEYAYTCKVNEKSDVYSFGVVLMELVTGKKPFELEFGENKDIVQWVCYEMRTKNNLIHLVDETISKASKDAVKVLKIALHCTMRNPSLRPTMRMVVQMLEEAEPNRCTEVVVAKAS